MSLEFHLIMSIEWPRLDPRIAQAHIWKGFGLLSLLIWQDECCFQFAN
jgi:hypothetical protein